MALSVTVTSNTQAPVLNRPFSLTANPTGADVRKTFNSGTLNFDIADTYMVDIELKSGALTRYAATTGGVITEPDNTLYIDGKALFINGTILTLGDQ